MKKIKKMNRIELFKAIDELRKEHPGEFDRWYETANFPGIEECCEIGWLILRYFN
jgi:hypothetical protein